MSHNDKHPIHGVVQSDVRRPSAETLRRYQGKAACLFVDAMSNHGAMDVGIKPLLPEARICGPALTVLTKPGDGLYVRRAMEFVRPGDIVVIDGGGDVNCSLVGDVVALAFKKMGAAALVIDGAVRDANGIIDADIPVFARGICLRHIGTNTGPGAVNVPIQCGGTIVHPGDIIVGDRDGVAVVPLSHAEEIAEVADRLDEEEKRGVAQFQSEGVDKWTAKFVSKWEPWERNLIGCKT